MAGTLPGVVTAGDPQQGNLNPLVPNANNSFWDHMGNALSSVAKKAEFVALTAIHTLQKIASDANCLERAFSLGCYIADGLGKVVSLSPLTKVLINFGNASSVIGFAQIGDGIRFFTRDLFDDSPADKKNPGGDTVRQARLKTWEPYWQTAFAVGNIGGILLTLDSWKVIDLGKHALSIGSKVATTVATCAVLAVQSFIAIGFTFLALDQIKQLWNRQPEDQIEKPILRLIWCALEVSLKVSVIIGSVAGVTLLTPSSPFIIVVGILAKVIGLIPVGLDAYDEIKRESERTQGMVKV